MFRSDRARLLAFLFAVSGGTAAANAQTASPSSTQDRITVTGQKMPGAEAPRFATCEALARDPFYRAALQMAGGEPLMGPRAYLPIRPPRNPDYSAPPSVPPGSPLPKVIGRRFGYRSADTTGASTGALDSEAVETASSLPGGASAMIAEAGTFENAVATCRNSYTRGGRPIGSDVTFSTIASSSATENAVGAFDPESRVRAANARFAMARAFILSRDRTLPLGFALFDQGRYAESLDWFKKASAKRGLRDGGDEAALFVGKLYLQGLGDRSDPALGVKWLKRAATAPYSPVTDTPMFDPDHPDNTTALGEASVMLANIYRNGFGGIRKDLGEARRWYARAWDVGHVPAAKAIGDLYAEGLGTARDPKAALGWYRKAAKFDYAPAQFALAELLYSGDDGVAQDRKEALRWYQAAAQRNHPGALFALARAFDFGDGVKADPQLALGFYKSAALRGSVPARTSLGTFYYEGKLVPKDDQIARTWFESAAKAGDVDGMVNLAAMLARGEGGAKDMPHAWAWLKQASVRRDTKAATMLAAVEQRMTPADRQAAAALGAGQGTGTLRN